MAKYLGFKIDEPEYECSVTIKNPLLVKEYSNKPQEARDFIKAGLDSAIGILCVSEDIRREIAILNCAHIQKLYRLIEQRRKGL